MPVGIPKEATDLKAWFLLKNPNKTKLRTKDILNYDSFCQNLKDLLF